MIHVAAKPAACLRYALHLLAAVALAVPLQLAVPGGVADAASPSYQVDSEQEQAFRDSVTALGDTDVERERADRTFEAMKARAPAAYQTLIRISQLDIGDPAGMGSVWWRTMMKSSTPVAELSLPYHEYTHLGQAFGTPQGPLGANAFISYSTTVLRLYPMDGYWVGVPDYRGLMPVREAFDDIEDPHHFDVLYLRSMSPGNNLFSILGELQAYTRQAELEMTLFDLRATDWSVNTRYSVLRTLYHVDLYLAHLHAAYPQQWDSLTATPAVPYLVKGLTERAWAAAERLKAFPRLAYDQESTEAATLAHTDSVQALIAAAGAAGPVALDPHTEPLDQYGIYVIDF
jgi:hypothetical protein